MTAPRRRGGALLVGLATGALLIGLATLVGGARTPTAGLDAAALPAGASVTGAGAPATSLVPGGTGSDAAADPATNVAAAAGGGTAAAGTAGAGARPGGRATTGSGGAPAASATPRATVVTAPRATRAVASGLTGPEQQVVTLTNAQRAQAGCAPLSVDARLTAAARGHSTDMATSNYFDHDSPDGRSFSDRETAAGYPSPGGENIAYGQQSASEVMNDWMNSDGHRRNILDCSFTTIGVGLATKGMYWTQDFGR